MLSSLLAFAMSGALPGTHALQPPGHFHAGEAVARHGERWLALRVRTGDARLDATRLRVKTVFDELVDAEGEATGTEVGSDQVDDVVAYLRGPGLHTGPLMQARIEHTTGDSRLLAHTLHLGDRAYQLATRCDPDPVVHHGFACAIDLIEGESIKGERRQTLVRMAGYRSQGDVDGGVSLGDDAAPAVIFAGDLDRDGKLDLIFDTTDHYNAVRPVLFLSGAAEGDELLHAVAEFNAVGC